MNIYKPNGSKVFYCRFNLNRKTYVRSTGLTDKQLARDWAFDLRNKLIAKKNDKEGYALVDCLNDYHGTIAKTPFGRPSKSYLSFMLILTRREGESIIVGEDIIVTVTQIRDGPSEDRNHCA